MIGDISLGGVAVGLHYIRLSGVRESGGSIVENFSLPGVVRFVRTQDLNYLTLWFTFGGYAGSIWTLFRSPGAMAAIISAALNALSLLAWKAVE